MPRRNEKYFVWKRAAGLGYGRRAKRDLNFFPWQPYLRVLAYPLK